MIYQIYPRSFQDSNGDGIGDLAGIAGRLPYIADLGADAIMISPFFKSPMADFGYDVSDYQSVDPLFGTLSDFTRLQETAHKLGIKVLIDLLISHTSEQHPWFIESRSSKDNAKADWYVWADPKADGTPPNNWLSLFGGSAWAWDTRRRQYYLHNFLSSQPDLNFHCKDVQAALLDTARFWLDQGVDGFRLDVVNFYFHDLALRDNPARPGGPGAAAVPLCNPYSYQSHLYDKTQPENLQFVRELRALVDQYPERTLIGEIGDDDQYGTLAAYTGGSAKLHMAYTFNLLTEKCSPRFIHETLVEFQRETGDAWACWSISNHDWPRVVSRWAALGNDPKLATLCAGFLISLRGSICVYQGEELGLTEADIPYELLQDPYGKTMWPEFKGRDGCRTPMPWQSNARYAGFSLTRPWLPIPEEHLALAVDIQEATPQSTLQRFRNLLRWRKLQKALLIGDIKVLEEHEQIVAFTRETIDQKILCAFNFSDTPASMSMRDAAAIAPLEGHGFLGSLGIDTIEIPPFEAFFGIYSTKH